MQGVQRRLLEAHLNGSGIVTDSLRIAGRGWSGASHCRSTANEIAVLADQNAQHLITKQDAQTFRRAFLTR